METALSHVTHGHPTHNKQPAGEKKETEKTNFLIHCIR